MLFPALLATTMLDHGAGALLRLVMIMIMVIFFIESFPQMRFEGK